MRPDSKYGILTFVAFSLRDMFLPCFLIFFVAEPPIQFGACFFFNTLCLGLLITTRPLASIWDNCLEIFNNITIYCLLIVYLLIYIFGGKLAESKKSTFLGIPIIFILIVTTLANLAYGTIFGVVAAYKTLKCRSKKSDKPKNEEMKSEERDSERFDSIV